MGLKEVLTSIFHEDTTINRPETAEDLVMEMRMHPKFKSVYWAAEDAGGAVSCWLRTFEDPSDRRGKTQTFSSISDLYGVLRNPEFQDRLAGKNFQISLFDAGQKLIEAFPKWQME